MQIFRLNTLRHVYNSCMQHHAITWEQLHSDCLHLVDIIKNTNKEYDLVIGLMRGGCVPATIISHALNVPMLAIGIKTYDDKTKVNHVDAYQAAYGDIYNARQRRSIINTLVVDDLSDTGDTFAYVSRTYSTVLHNMDTAAPYIKSHTTFRPTYHAKEFTNNEWLVFPWESH
jgi:hypoxanthine phosphoribosyltransferase